MRLSRLRDSEHGAQVFVRGVSMSSASGGEPSSSLGNFSMLGFDQNPPSRCCTGFCSPASGSLCYGVFVSLSVFRVWHSIGESNASIFKRLRS